MVKQIEVYGKPVKLYKVGFYENAWCSDPELALKLQEKREALERQLRTVPKAGRHIVEEEL